MDRFYIITNSDKDSNLAITGKITEYLKAHGRSCEVQQAERKHEGAYHYTDPSKIPDCLLYTSPSPRDRCLSRMPSSA